MAPIAAGSSASHRSGRRVQWRGCPGRRPRGPPGFDVGSATSILGTLSRISALTRRITPLGIDHLAVLPGEFDELAGLSEDGALRHADDAGAAAAAELEQSFV